MGAVGNQLADDPGVGYIVPAALSVAALQSDRFEHLLPHEGPVSVQGDPQSLALGNCFSGDQVRLFVICLFLTGGVKGVCTVVENLLILVGVMSNDGNDFITPICGDRKCNQQSRTRHRTRKQTLCFC